MTKKKKLKFKLIAIIGGIVLLAIAALVIYMVTNHKSIKDVKEDITKKVTKKKQQQPQHPNLKSGRKSGAERNTLIRIIEKRA